MAKAKKMVIKKSSIRTASKRNSKSRVVVSKSSKSWFGRFSTRTKVLFIVAIGLVGSYFVYASFANSPANYLVGMGTAGAITATQDASGNVQISGSSLAFQITPDNQLQCTNVNSGDITTAQLTPAQTSDIANQVIAAGITSQANTVVAKGQGVLTGTWVTVNTNGVNKTVNIIGNAESTAFGRAVKAVAKDACKQATKTAKNSDLATLGNGGKKLTQAQGNKLAQKIEDAINAKVYADSGYGLRMETAQYVGVKYWRNANGLTKNFMPAACLRDSARIHSQRMASVDTMSHQLPGEPVFTTRITNNCPSASKWVWAGENVAWNSDDSVNGVALLIDLMATEKPPNDGHRQNDLNSHFDYMGAGAYWCDSCGNDGHPRVYITNDFASFSAPVPTYDTFDDWSLNGTATVSAVADNVGAQTLYVKPGQAVYYHYRIANAGTSWASFTQYRTWKHYAANGTVLSNTDEHAESSDGIGWGKHGDGWAASTTQYPFSGRYYDDFTADSGAVTIPSNAQNGEKFCRLIHYTNAFGPSTNAQNSNEACAVIKT